MENMREYLYMMIECEKKSIRKFEELQEAESLRVLKEFRQEQINKCEGAIEAYENMLLKVTEYEKHGNVLPF